MGLINSIQIHCLQLTHQQLRVKPNKKKKKEQKRKRVKQL